MKNSKAKLEDWISFSKLINQTLHALSKYPGIRKPWLRFYGLITLRRYLSGIWKMKLMRAVWKHGQIQLSAGKPLE